MNNFAEFVEAIRRGSSENVRLGRERAIGHVRKIGLSDADAQALYQKLTEAYQDTSLALTLPMQSTESLLQGTAPALNNPSLDSKHKRAAEILGCSGFDPAPVSATKNPKLDKSREDCCLLVHNIADQVAFLGADIDALTDPSRADYVENVKNALYDHASLPHCCAVKSMMGLKDTDLSLGVDGLTQALASLDQAAPGFLFGQLEPKKIQQILVDDVTKQWKLRSVAYDVGRFMPVSLIGPAQSLKPSVLKAPSEKPSAEMEYFAKGDSVCTKPIQPNSKVGTVVSIDANGVVVEWDEGSRTAFCLPEALATLMPVPINEAPKVGDVQYSLPGMSDETVLILDNLGIDPVSLYSLLSHVRPANQNAPSPEALNDVLAVLGLQTALVDGYALQEGESYGKHQWHEAALPNGSRLIIDFKPNAIVVKAGRNLDEYVVPDGSAAFLDE